METTASSFFSYVRRKTKSKTPIGPLKRENLVSVQDPGEIADMINDFFCTVFTREDQNRIPEPRKTPVRTRLRRSWITTKKVRDKIKNLRHSAPGQDGIAPKMLNSCGEEIVWKYTIIDTEE